MKTPEDLNIDSTSDSKTQKIPIAVWIIILLFLIKSLLLAFFITPLWDIPDEPGHLAYIIHIAEGEGIPVLGEAIIHPEIVKTWYTKSEQPSAVSNWIAQHPPGYYLLGAPIYKIASFFTEDTNVLFRSTRILSSISAALALVVFYIIFMEVSNSRTFSIVTMTAISVIPMYSHMSSGTNHDTFLSLISALAILYWIRFIKYNDFKYAIFMGIWLSIAGFTKITTLAMAGPMVAITFFHLKGSIYGRLSKWILTGFIAGVLPGLWMVRNWILFRNPLMDVTYFDKIRISGNEIAYIDFLKTQPIVEFTYRHFWGLIGWTGSGGGELLWFQIPYEFLGKISFILMAIMLSSFFWYAKHSINFSNKNLFLVLSSIIMLFTIFYTFLWNKPYLLQNKIVFSLFFSCSIFSLLLLSSNYKKRFPHNILILYSLIIIMLFITTYVVKIKDLYEIYGTLRATHGRYLYPLISLFVTSFVYPAFKLVKPHQLVMYILCIFMLGLELSFFITKVIPFYQGVF